LNFAFQKEKEKIEFIFLENNKFQWVMKKYQQKKLV